MATAFKIKSESFKSKKAKGCMYKNVQSFVSKSVTFVTQTII